MLYAVRFSGYKIDTFLKIFCVFQEVCRLEYLKPFTCKGSRSELFPITSPRKGMETQIVLPFNMIILISFPITSPRKGMETPHSPGGGWWECALSDHIAPQGDGNSQVS